MENGWETTSVLKYVENGTYVRDQDCYSFEVHNTSFLFVQLPWRNLENILPRVNNDENGWIVPKSSYI